jgi:hypothetical protein
MEEDAGYLGHNPQSITAKPDFLCDAFVRNEELGTRTHWNNRAESAAAAHVIYIVLTPKPLSVDCVHYLQVISRWGPIGGEI